LSICIMTSVFSIGEVSASATNGTCGDDLTYVLDDNGTMTISGTGTILDLDGGGTAFRQSIKKIEINAPITRIENFTFNTCDIQEIIIPETVTSIGENAFYLCDRLQKIFLYDNIKSIEEEAFLGCSNLREIFYAGSKNQWSSVNIGISNDRFEHIPVTYNSNISDFYKTTSLVSYEYSDVKTGNSIVEQGTLEGNTNWILYDNGTLVIGGYGEMERFYSGSSKAPWHSLKSQIKSVIINEGITNISSASFFECSNLEKIVIPNSIAEVENDAFEECVNLKKVYYEGDLESWLHIDFSFGSVSSPTSYGAELYVAGKLIKDVVIPSSIIEIKNDTFYGCTSIETVKIPNNVYRISDYW